MLDVHFLGSINNMNTLILKENLKLYNPFHNRGIFAIFVFALYALSFCFSSLNSGELTLYNFYPVRPMIFFFFSMYLLGQVAVLPQFDLLIKPQFLCLPDSQKIMKKVLLTIGSIVMLFCSLIVMPFDNPGSVIWILRIITAPVLGLPFYLLAICLSFYLRADAPNNRLIKYCIYLLVILVIVVGIMIGDYSLSLKGLIIYWIIPLAISSITLLIALTKILGEFDIIRKYHTGIYIPWFAVALNKDNQLDIAPRKSNSNKSEKNLAEKYFLKGMKQQSFLSLNRSILGTIYQMIERKIDFETVSKYSFPIKIIFSISILFLTGYFPSDRYIFVFSHMSIMLQFYCLLIPCIVINGIFNTSPYQLLLPTGRSEQFFINIIITSIKLVSGVTYITFIIAISWALKNVMPEIIFSGQSYIYTPLNTGLIFWSIAIISATNFLSFYTISKRGKNNYLQAILGTSIIILPMFVLVFKPDLDHRMVILTIFLIIGMDILQHAGHWFRQDLI